MANSLNHGQLLRTRSARQRRLPLGIYWRLYLGCWSHNLLFDMKSTTEEAILRLLKKMRTMCEISPTLAAAADVGSADRERLESIIQQLKKK